MAGSIVLGLGIVFVLTRSNDRRFETSAPVPPVETAASTQPASVDASMRPARATPTPARPAPARAPVEAAPDELPIWARPPKVLTMPYPEGGKYNPPLPPVKLLPEMLDQTAPLTDAAVGSADR
jgi:transglutaminase-like putative cysteine protease